MHLFSFDILHITNFSSYLFHLSIHLLFHFPIISPFRLLKVSIYTIRNFSPSLVRNFMSFFDIFCAWVYAFVYVDFCLRRLVPFSLVYIHLIHLPFTLFIFSSHHLMLCFTSSVFSLADPIHRFYLLRFTCILYDMTNFSPHLSRLSLCSAI